MEESQFLFDVFLSHSTKDKPVVRAIAERLRADGVRVWFDEWEIKIGDSIPAKIEEGLERSRVLVLWMSANAFGSDWAALESQTFRFRDPLNKERRFIPLRLDDSPIKGSLAQFLYIDWSSMEREQGYVKLLEACRLSEKSEVEPKEHTWKRLAEKTIQLGSGAIYAYAFSPNGKRALTGGGGINNTVRMWDLETGQCLRVFIGHQHGVNCIVWSQDQARALSSSLDGTIRVWDVKSGHCVRVMGEPKVPIYSVALSADQRFAISGAADCNVRMWDLETGQCLRVLKGHTELVYSVVWSKDQHYILSGSGSPEKTIRMWDSETGRCVRIFEGHTNYIRALEWHSDQIRALSSAEDRTIRMWDLDTGRCLRVLEGHTKTVSSIAWSADKRFVLSGSYDNTVRLWDVESGRCLRILKDHTVDVRAVAWNANGNYAYSGDKKGGIRVWNLSDITAARQSQVTVPALSSAPDQVQYTNAKVLLVGESGAGKTGLSKRLALNNWEPSDSTVGAWATQWKLPVASGDGVEREIWLWDFGGQADQRLIHQLYMDETALAVLVFDGQKEDLFETLGQWDRDLVRASRKPFNKLLVLGRKDAGGLRVSRGEMEKFAQERQFRGFLETSAKQNLGCEELKKAILSGIDWDELPCRTTEVLFKRLKEEIIRLKDEGRVLLRFNELREILQLRLSDEFPCFTDEELRAVLTLLAGPGVVWELKFGAWVLLQPERINAYAQAVIQTLRTDEHERGCLSEERVLRGDLVYHSSMTRLETDEERFILLAMHQTLVERGLCLREHTAHGPLLVFPNYYRRERPDLVGHPAVLVSYRFNGFLDDIYATLVTRLHHARDFDYDQLWRYAADFRTTTGGGRQLGVKLTRRAQGVGELAVYFDPAISTQEKIIFSRYVHEHLWQSAKDVERLRHYVCPHCGEPVENRAVAMKRLDAWLQNRQSEQPTILCVECEKRVPLWDELEECFASPEVQRRVRELQEQSAHELDNESKERALVGEVISTVALAGQISREKTVSDHGIDMEIEFKDGANEATGRMLLLQLKSGDSFLRERKRDGAEIFAIKDERHARYWMAQAFPVLLVIRNSEGEVRWMEIREYLCRESDNGKKPVKRIVFEGERFDVMSVRRWRDKVLNTLKAPESEPALR
jgi:small GTP-binding protein